MCGCSQAETRFPAERETGFSILLTNDDGINAPGLRVLEAIATEIAGPGGEVWTVADCQAMRAATGCADVMLGRGAVADPFLAARIRSGANEAAADWPMIAPLILDFWSQVQRKVLPRQAPGRLKQWLGLMRRMGLARPAEKVAGRMGRKLTPGMIS